MSKRKFGTRTAISRMQAENKETHSLHRVDYVGIGILCAILALLPITSQLSEPVSSLVGFICTAFEIPNGFADGWISRATVDASNEIQHSGMLGLNIDMPVRSILVAAHQASLVLGLGSAIFLDLYLMQFLHHRAINQQTIEIAEFGSSLVTLGLALIWLSGLSILLYYYMTEPALLQNPKIWSKLIVVYALSINGHFIHKYVLPNLRHNFGKRVLDNDFISVAKSSLVVASVSIVSWGFAFILGAFKELNNIVPAPTILLAYILSLLVVYFAMVVICGFLVRQRSGTPKISRNNPVAALSKP